LRPEACISATEFDLHGNDLHFCGFGILRCKELQIITVFEKQADIPCFDVKDCQIGALETVAMREYARTILVSAWKDTQELIVPYLS